MTNKEKEYAREHKDKTIEQLQLALNVVPANSFSRSYNEALKENDVIKAIIELKKDNAKSPSLASIDVMLAYI